MLNSYFQTFQTKPSSSSMDLNKIKQLKLRALISISTINASVLIVLFHSE